MQLSSLPFNIAFACAYVCKPNHTVHTHTQADLEQRAGAAEPVRAGQEEEEEEEADDTQANEK